MLQISILGHSAEICRRKTHCKNKVIGDLDSCESKSCALSPFLGSFGRPRLNPWWDEIHDICVVIKKKWVANLERLQFPAVCFCHYRQHLSVAHHFLPLPYVPIEWHILYKPYIDWPGASQFNKIIYLVIIDAPHQNHIYLHFKGTYHYELYFVRVLCFLSLTLIHECWTVIGKASIVSWILCCLLTWNSFSTASNVFLPSHLWNTWNGMYCRILYDLCMLRNPQTFWIPEGPALSWPMPGFIFNHTLLSLFSSKQDGIDILPILLD